jgi:very-short-patch-repair endonuclease
VSSSDLERALLFQVKALGLPEPVQEHQFSPPRRWRFDFAWPDLKVAVEVEGGSFVGGRHTRGAAFEADCRKYAEATCQGWAVLRVTGRMIEEGTAIEFVKRALAIAGLDELRRRILARP